MVLTNSIFRGFLDCPARTMAEHGGLVTGDGRTPEWHTRTTEAMACGSLVDAIITRGLTGIVSSVCPATDLDAVQAALASSYSDGAETLDTLLTKKGEWTAAARTAISAARRLLADPDVSELLADPRTRKQARITFMVAPDVTWRGDIDLLVDDADCVRVVDLKAPGRIEDGWIAAGGKNVKVAWWEAWQYWFQLSGYAYGLASDSATVDGSPFERAKPIRAGLLYATRGEYPAIGYQPVPLDMEAWEMAVMLRLDAIRAIVDGDVQAPMCGRCDYCASRSRVQIADCSPSDTPVIDDVFGIPRREEDL